MDYYLANRPNKRISLIRIMKVTWMKAGRQGPNPKKKENNEIKGFKSPKTT